MSRVASAIKQEYRCPLIPGRCRWNATRMGSSSRPAGQSRAIADLMRLDPDRVEFAPKPQSPKRRLPLGLIGSLLLHLLPLLAIGGWLHEPAESSVPIPIQLVFEQPPPSLVEPPAPVKPPRGRHASDDFGEIAVPKVEPTDAAPKAAEPQPPNTET